MSDFEIVSDIEKKKIDDKEHYFVTVSYQSKAHIVGDGDEAIDKKEELIQELKQLIETSDETEPERVQCNGTTADGDRCTRTTTDESGYCYQHR